MTTHVIHLLKPTLFCNSERIIQKQNIINFTKQCRYFKPTLNNTNSLQTHVAITYQYLKYIIDKNDNKYITTTFYNKVIFSFPYHN